MELNKLIPKYYHGIYIFKKDLKIYSPPKVKVCVLSWIQHLKLKNKEIEKLHITITLTISYES